MSHSGLLFLNQAIYCAVDALSTDEHAAISDNDPSACVPVRDITTLLLDLNSDILTPFTTQKICVLL